jgi:hypothetical protein
MVFFLLCFLIASTYQLTWNFTRSDAMKLMQFVASRRDGISRWRSNAWQKSIISDPAVYRNRSCRDTVIARSTFSYWEIYASDDGSERVQPHIICCFPPTRTTRCTYWAILTNRRKFSVVKNTGPTRRRGFSDFWLGCGVGVQVRWRTHFA